MTDIHAIMSLINTAIREEGSIFIRYRDYHGNLTDRMISPLEWSSNDKVIAFCHLRKAERNFNVRNIVDISNEPFSEMTIPNLERNSQEFQSTARPQVIPTPARQPVRPPVKRTAFSRVTSADDWSDLLSYYRDCLNFEYQHQFSFYKKELQLVKMPDEEVYSFLSGKNYLEYKYNQMGEELRNFFDTRNNSNKQLCFGKSFVCLSSGEITPLLFVPINIDNSVRDRVVLKPDELCLSYASLLKLDFSSEEVADFIQEYEDLLDSKPTLMEMENYVVKSLSERLTRPLPVFSHEDYSLEAIGDYSIYDGTGFFWADSRFTGNLIKELEDLKEPKYWFEVPNFLPGLFNAIPEHRHAPAPDFIEDQKFYVTDINTQQRKAAQAVADHPITIITGPPGTGKSQLVLNLIAQAYWLGQKVLFASHNNKAVDVVMERLQGEINFQGAIRTGSRENRKRAVEQMESALNQIHTPDISGYQQKYQEGKITLQKTHDTLQQVRDLLGKLQSYQTEKEGVLEHVPFAWRENFNQMNFPVNEQEKTRVLEVLSELSENFRLLAHQRQKLVDSIRDIFSNKEMQASSLRPFVEYELRWGQFGEGLLHKEDFSSLGEVRAYCNSWRNVLQTLLIKKDLIDLTQAHRQIKQNIETNSNLLNEEQNGIVLELSDKSDVELRLLEQRLLEAQSKTDQLNNNRFSWLQKLFISLGVINPKKIITKQLQLIQGDLGLTTLTTVDKGDELEGTNENLQVLKMIVDTGKLLQKETAVQEKINKVTSQQADMEKLIPQEIVNEFDRLNLAELSFDTLKDALFAIEQTAEKHEGELANHIQRAISFFIKNEELLTVISSIQKLDEISEVKGTFGLHEENSEQQAFDWAHLWRMAIALWEINSVIFHSQAQLDELPPENQAFEEYQNASKSLFQVAGDLMRETWFKRAAESPNDTLVGTEKYISAVKQLNELNWGRDRDLYSFLKEQERRNFPHAIKMFPIWAITNLTARTNFPLDSELFDLVIVDEASQCDIPSVIPLLYRAKKVVIIGDPNQLRHVASLNANLNEQIGAKYGVGLDSYSYTALSLYDLGARSVGQHPGAILLDEHYRSDPRIITFSNEEFYGNQLVIKTDLTRRGYSKEFLNTRGGVCWIDVRGEYRKPANGSAENLAELRQIQELLPRVIKALDENGYKRATIGIVTPFRPQENLLRNWLQNHPNSNRIRSGTAHQFQGDECDVMIFSPVLSDGIPEGTLGWLENTANLLNVAITRARVSLIIVGDLEFCLHQLNVRSRYHKLAKYVKERLGQAYSSLNEIPLLNGKKVEIVGTILDPSNPEHNRITLTRFIASCQEYVYWIDPYFSSEIIDLFDELYEKEPYPNLKTIKLLTAERQIKHFNGKPPAIRTESIDNLAEYLKEFGVNFEMRVLPGEDLPHDRYLYHDGGAINMPPFAGAFGVHRHLSEYVHTSTTVKLFEEHWKKAIPL
jgi:superfamily I DNA and/or RNA helicase